jgi:predicted ATPase
MIRHVRFENFRSLREVELQLEPLTVLVGANASGKSNVFAALGGAYEQRDRWRNNPSLGIRVSGTMTSGAEWAVMMPPNQTPFLEKGKPMRVQVLQLDLTKLRQPNTLAEERLLSSSGLGLANAFATLSRSAQDLVSKRFCALVPMFADVATRASGNGMHRIVFQDRWNSGQWYEPDQVSDGSMLMLAYLLLPHQTPAPGVIAIEEPERGLHPYLMGQLVDVLRKLSQGGAGQHKVQILLATHSAELLEHVRPEEVRFLSRNKDTGETIVEEAPVGSPTWRDAFKEYDDSLGRLWLSGGLGGVPGGP